MFTIQQRNSLVTGIEIQKERFTQFGIPCLNCVRCWTVMCGVFVSLFLLRCYLYKYAHDQTYTNTKIIHTTAHIHRWLRAQIHITHARTHHTICNIAERTCFAGHELSIHFWISRYVLNNNKNNHDYDNDEYNGLRGRSLARLTILA